MGWCEKPLRVQLPLHLSGHLLQASSPFHIYRIQHPCLNVIFHGQIFSLLRWEFACGLDKGGAWRIDTSFNKEAEILPQETPSSRPCQILEFHALVTQRLVEKKKKNNHSKCPPQLNSSFDKYSIDFQKCHLAL